MSRVLTLGLFDLGKKPEAPRETPQEAAGQDSYYAQLTSDERIKNLGEYLTQVALKPSVIDSKRIDNQGKVWRVRQTVMKESGLAVLKDYEIEAMMWETHAADLLYTQNGMLDELADSFLEEIENRCLFSRSKEGDDNFLLNSIKSVQRKETFIHDASQLRPPSWKGFNQG